jgi:Glyoxalase-like domain
MAVELDHVFVCVTPSAPEAELLVQFGLSEGPSNVHSGQGTANRRFFFRNAMLELLWVDNSADAQSQQTAPTLLWERWSGRGSGACPFGIIVRPADAGGADLPFPAWQYRPLWLPADLQIYVAPTGVEEPMWLFMPFMRRILHEQRFVPHPSGVQDITRLTLTTPALLQSSAARALAESEVFFEREGPEYLLTVEFDHGLRQEMTDFRPDLPLIFQR